MYTVCIQNTTSCYLRMLSNDLHIRCVKYEMKCQTFIAILLHVNARKRMAINLNSYKCVTDFTRLHVLRLKEIH